MTTGEAAQILKRMYDEGKSRKKAVVAIHLFGIIYANELSHLSVSQVVEESGIGRSYEAEVSKGCKLAEYVSVVKEFP